MLIKVGDKVKKNPDTWESNEFDSWYRGEGIGTVVEPPFFLEDGVVDVRWPSGRCFEYVSQLIKVEDDNGEQQTERSQDQASQEKSPH